MTDPNYASGLAFPVDHLTGIADHRERVLSFDEHLILWLKVVSDHMSEQLDDDLIDEFIDTFGDGTDGLDGENAIVAALTVNDNWHEVDHSDGEILVVNKNNEDGLTVYIEADDLAQEPETVADRWAANVLRWRDELS